MVDVDDQLIAALDPLRGDVWSCVLRDSTSPITLLLSLDPSVLNTRLGPLGNIPIPEFWWDFLAPLDFWDVTPRDLGEMPEISHVIRWQPYPVGAPGPRTSCPREAR